MNVDPGHSKIASAVHDRKIIFCENDFLLLDWLNEKNCYLLLLLCIFHVFKLSDK